MLFKGSSNTDVQRFFGGRFWLIPFLGKFCFSFILEIIFFVDIKNDSAFRLTLPMHIFKTCARLFRYGSHYNRWFRSLVTRVRHRLTQFKWVRRMIEIQVISVLSCEWRLLHWRARGYDREVSVGCVGLCEGFDGLLLSIVHQIEAFIPIVSIILFINEIQLISENKSLNEWHEWKWSAVN